jgi:hypothetical protein
MASNFLVGFSAHYTSLALAIAAVSDREALRRYNIDRMTRIPGCLCNWNTPSDVSGSEYLGWLLVAYSEAKVNVGLDGHPAMRRPNSRLTESHAFRAMLG